MVEPNLEDIFSALKNKSYTLTSPPDGDYNCIAWAAGDTQNWWWPDEAGQDTWPAGVARVATVAAFRDAFATLGYESCNDERLETGYEKVALFGFAAVPKHMSRQLASGRWTSKLGRREDIEHELHDLTGMVYGSVVWVMKRPISTEAVREGILP